MSIACIMSGQLSCTDSLNIRIDTLLVDAAWITGYTHCISGHQMYHRTDCWIEWINLTDNYVDKTVVLSDWFHYCIIQWSNALLQSCAKSARSLLR